MLFSDFATRRVGRTGKWLKLSLVDIKKAYLNGVPRRKIYLHLPKKLGLGPAILGYLIKCAYGRRDAGAIWEDTYADALGEESPHLAASITWSETSDLLSTVMTLPPLVSRMTLTGTKRRWQTILN